MGFIACNNRPVLMSGSVLKLLFAYRINVWTVVFLGYDDRYQRGTRIDTLLFQTTEFQRTNRVFFGKISCPFWYQLLS